MTIEIKVTAARELGMKKCPRCLRWTKNDGPAIEDGIVCWRCQDVVCHEESLKGHWLTQRVREWRESKGLPIE